MITHNVTTNIIISIKNMINNKQNTTYSSMFYSLSRWYKSIGPTHLPEAISKGVHRLRVFVC